MRLKLLASPGMAKQPVRQHIAEYASDPPFLSSVEPVIAADVGRIESFVGLVDGLPAGEYAIEEARLFWHGRVLHVIATPTGCRWVKLTEEQAATDDKDTVTTADRTVALMRDHARFGRDAIASCDRTQFVVREYRNGSTVVAWRILHPSETAGRGSKRQHERTDPTEERWREVG